MKNLTNRIDNTLENLLADIYKEKNIKQGDITPHQVLEWENLVNKMSLLFNELIKQNNT